MMEKDLKLAQALAKGLINSQKNSRSNSPAGGDPDGTLNTDASMVLEKIQGFRLVFPRHNHMYYNNSVFLLSTMGPTQYSSMNKFLSIPNRDLLL